MVSRRILLRRALQLGVLGGAGASLAWLLHDNGSGAPGNHLVFGIFADPFMVTSAFSSAGSACFISGKVFDGLLTYDFELNPQAQLAVAWETSSDGLSITFRLRPGVRWHDGQPFGSADVAFSLLDVWKKYHSRGITTFAPVLAVDTPDPLTAVLRLSQPAPYLLTALASTESQILPRHLYQGRDILSNPYNNAPVGTGPFRFVEWVRGSHLILDRNPDYWDNPRPYLEHIVYRVLPDAAARAAALEAGEIHLIGYSQVPLSDVERLGHLPHLEVTNRGYAYTAGISSLEFNLERAPLDDPRVRHAIAHAIDHDLLVRNIWYGHATAATGPVPQSLSAFYSAEVPHYPFDLERAAHLLDRAGLPPNAHGQRLQLTLDPSPTSDALRQVAEYLRDSLQRIGIDLVVRRQDFGAFISRVYQARDFDLSLYGASAAPDPAISIQRFYWSHSIKPGVAFSNGSHYRNAQVDSLIEAAQTELDPQRRRQLYVEFQRQVQTDLPLIPLVAPRDVTLANRRLRHHTVTGDGLMGNFAQAVMEPTPAPFL
ncbi:ABC transporter substrate-binding protein [Pseudomonas sp. LRF_L74]|uniref:ABC transporter substrate-binding protein n=1 Tax=Pseudomonas sp. LRF_L74 TaxID=3369422 RepID=UPI003F5F691F